MKIKISNNEVVIEECTIEECLKIISHVSKDDSCVNENTLQRDKTAELNPNLWCGPHIENNDLF